jgi:hypothetical protein
MLLQPVQQRLARHLQHHAGFHGVGVVSAWRAIEQRDLAEPGGRPHAREQRLARMLALSAHARKADAAPHHGKQPALQRIAAQKQRLARLQAARLGQLQQQVREPRLQRAEPAAGTQYGQVGAASRRRWHWGDEGGWEPAQESMSGG